MADQDRERCEELGLSWKESRHGRRDLSDAHRKFVPISSRGRNARRTA